MNEPHQNVATASQADGTELPLPEILKNDRLVSRHPYETLQGSCERDDSRMTMLRTFVTDEWIIAACAQLDTSAVLHYSRTPVVTCRGNLLW